MTGLRQPLPFSKMQAVGNDFVVVDESAWPTGMDWDREAITLCDRHKGIGGDGLLVVCMSDTADVRMRMFNPDGTEDMCGNGLRCVARWAVEHGCFHPAGEAQITGLIDTLVGPRRAVATLLSGKIGEIVTDMGVPSFQPTMLPMNVTDRPEIIDFPLDVAGFGTVVISSVNTGSTHTVLWVDELPEDDRFFGLSPAIENHPLFPERTSVLWASASAAQQFDIRIWERGVGETLGCGTGACAVAVLASRRNKQAAATPLIDSPEEFVVRSKGGQLTVRYRAGDDPVSLQGTAHTVFTGLF